MDFGIFIAFNGKLFAASSKDFPIERKHSDAPPYAHQPEDTLPPPSLQENDVPCSLVPLKLEGCGKALLHGRDQINGIIAPCSSGEKTKEVAAHYHDRAGLTYAPQPDEGLFKMWAEMDMDTQSQQGQDAREEAYSVSNNHVIEPDNTHI